MHRSPLPVPVCVCAFQRAARFGGGGLYGKVGATFLAALPEGAWRRAGVVLGGLGSRKRSEGAGTVIIIVIAVGNWPTGGGGEGELRPTRHQCGCGWVGGWVGGVGGKSYCALIEAAPPGSGVVAGQKKGEGGAVAENGGSTDAGGAGEGERTEKEDEGCVPIPPDG